MSILTTHNLAIGYRKKDEEIIIQPSLHLELKPGEMVCMIGPNGAGKSTLLRTLSGLLPALEGEIRIGNSDIRKLKTAEKATLISLVLTDKVEIENATVKDVVGYGRHPHSNWWGGFSEEDEYKISEAIEMVHLEHKAGKFLAELSDGERQRAMIAKALAQDTPIILLDEPTAHLDLPNRVEIMLLLHRLAHTTDKAILLSTHELDMALQAADRIWLISDKHGVESGVPEDLVLNGTFSRVFQSKSYVFNSSNGNFSMNYPMRHKVWVTGDKTRMYWTLRALARAAYQVVQDAPVEIRIDDNKWIVGGEHFLSIEELLANLEEITK